MKKLEVIFLKTVMDEVVNIIDGAGLSGYTIFKAYKGRGTRHGESLEFGFSGSQESYYLISICDAETIDKVLDNCLDDLLELEALVMDSDIRMHEHARKS